MRAGEKEGAGGLSVEMKRAAQEDATAPVLDIAKIFAIVIMFKFKSGKKTENVSLVQNLQCHKSKTGEIVFPTVLELIVFISAKKWAEIVMNRNLP